MDQKTIGLYFSLFNEIGIINQLSRAMLNARLPEGLQTSHFSVLNHLLRVSDGPTPLAVARAFQVSKTTMAHTLSGLEKNALVELRPNPKDGRSKNVWITDKGRRFRDDAVQSFAPMLGDLATELPVETAAAIVAELSNIRKILDNNRDP